MMKYKIHISLDISMLLVLAVIVVLYLWPVIIQQKILLPLDMLSSVEPWASERTDLAPAYYHNPEPTDAIFQFFPMGSYATQARTTGNLSWDPYVLSGMPAQARGEMFSHPLFWLLLQFLPVAKAFSWMAVLHLMIGLFSMYAFMREWNVGPWGATMGSLAFGLNNYIMNWLVFPVVTGSLIWVPLIFWGYERSLRRGWYWAIIGGIAFGLQILSGSILWPGYTAITLGVYAIGRALFYLRDTWRWRDALWVSIKAGILLGVGVLLTASQVLLTAELFQQAGRTDAIGASSGLNGLLYSFQLLDPLLLGAPVLESGYDGAFNFTETSLYFGVPALLLMISGTVMNQRRMVTWMFAIGLLCLLAVYQIPLIRQLIATIYPFFLNSFPGRILGMIAFVWAAVAGFHTDWILNVASARSVQAVAVFAVMVTLLCMSFYGVVSTDIYLSWPMQWVFAQLKVQANHIHRASLLTTATWCGVTATILWLWSSRTIRPGLFAGLLIAVAVIDLFFANGTYNRAFDEDRLYPETESISVLHNLLQNEPTPVRILPVNSGNILPGMIPQHFLLMTASGYSSWVLDRYAQYADLTGFRSQASISHLYFYGCCNALLDALGIRYVYASPHDFPNSAADRVDLISILSTASAQSGIDGGIHVTEWPIDDVPQRILFAHAPSRISYPLYLRDVGTLHSIASVNPEAWTQITDGVSFEVFAQRSATSKKELLFSAWIDSTVARENPAGIPVTIDLSNYADIPFVLSFETTPGPNQDQNYDWSGWVDPIIDLASGAPLQLIHDGTNRIYRNHHALPRAWMVYQVNQVTPGDMETVEKLLVDPYFAPDRSAVIESDMPMPLHAPIHQIDRRETVKFVKYAAEAVDLHVYTPTPGLLVLSDVMYPGWKVYVDDVEQPIYYTNLIMRGVYLEAGDHRVEFRFEPDLLAIGRIVSTITITLIIFILIYHFAPLGIKNGVRLWWQKQKFIKQQGTIAK